MRRLLLPLLAAVLFLPLPGRAEPLRAVYGVQAAGMQVMRVEVMFDLDSPRHYRIESAVHLTGLARWFSAGRQVNRVEGLWREHRAQPVRFVGDGVWRGKPRQVVLEYPDGQATLRHLVPAEDPEREPVPPALWRGTVDALTPVAQMARNLARTGRCEAEATVFDGRRRAEFTARTLGRDRLAPWREAWSGEAVRCGFTGRQTAGFRHDDERDLREPQEAIAWMASPRPGAPVLPVRVEMPGRWLGPLTAYLLELGPA
ncbi:DUF3108 domain-containing protein [Teichococcus aestuarii]|uniref:DUF3108 domain-containing protein n=1 Tax=Teichococcus aestuarii TaxID=568898 RepID=UPI0036142066